MEEIVGMELDELPEQEALHAKIKRLPAYLKAELDDMYYEFQHQLHILAIKNQIHAAFFYTYLGQINQMRGPTSYNNFCRFDPKARAIFAQKSIPLKQRCKDVGQVWYTIDSETKAKYKDPSYIKSIRGDTPVVVVNGTIKNARRGVVKTQALNLGSNKKDIAFVWRWAKDTIDQLNEISACHKVQGILVLALGRSSGDLFIQGGTQLGHNFLQILIDGGDPLRKFHTYAAGMAVQEEILNGALTSSKGFATEEIDQNQPISQDNKGGEHLGGAGSLKKNKKEISSCMLDLLNAAGGKHFHAWPGKNAASKLREANIQMKVKRNPSHFHAREVCQPVNQLLLIPSRRILQALTKEWISLKYKGDDAELSNLDESPDKDLKSEPNVNVNSNTEGMNGDGDLSV
ncbi:uncharacterized protein PGTG_21845 [Puccinia graminis f. sp. tritici CRL 75-36-700-3]|uniref:Uncharacterized protein n=1 Tax=Puccinia graminis f. sp. tritici (strain CRL 75-36-700-3 / race SCCL) TaxID=418459 RepID=H6QSK2_PUCGT|nr:uncharacterized protein PGTG_21845 [Puccinia graminis f. sp. tritici CRL 75-36-700-3]EHS63753.1 hypothetical protein PGTG_21845 [Puccinia graminis f. sp. tritici CRL 75-36-700-3]